MTTAVQNAAVRPERTPNVGSTSQPSSSHPGVATARGLAVVLTLVMGVQFLISVDMLPMLGASAVHPALILTLQSAAGMMLPLFIGVGAVSILFIAAVLLANAGRVSE